MKSSNIMLKYRLYVLLLFFFNLAFSQKSDFDKFRELLIKSYNYEKDFKYIQSLEYAKEASKVALKLQDSEAIAKSYSRLASVTSLLGLYRQSLDYSFKASKEYYTKSDIDLQATILDRRGMVYREIGYSDKAIEQYKKIINLIPFETQDIKLGRQLAAAYENIGSSYDYLPENADSILQYSKKSISIFRRYPENRIYDDLYISYLINGGTYLDLKKQPDSAMSYFKKSYAIIKKYDNDFPLFEYNCSLGTYYFYQKNYYKALEYYQKATNDSKVAQPQIDVNIIEIYKNMSEIYDILGNPLKSKQYLRIYSQKNAALFEKNKKDAEYALKILLDEEEQHKKKSLKGSALIICSILFVLIISLIYYFKEKNKRIKISAESQKALQKKQIIITEQKKEGNQLKQKANEAFNEVLLLAKENNPHFLKRFQEVYPEFYDKILQINPTLKPSEISLSAYIFLGFSNKEIADYTFKSIRTIESNRYNLRKKMDLPTNIDFYVWLNSLKQP